MVPARLLRGSEGLARMPCIDFAYAKSSRKSAKWRAARRYTFLNRCKRRASHRYSCRLPDGE
eukprot:scaffold28624_cov128-Isochrysis_galbana.AAC.5